MDNGFQFYAGISIDIWNIHKISCIYVVVDVHVHVHICFVRYILCTYESICCIYIYIVWWVTKCESHCLVRFVSKSILFTSLYHSSECFWVVVNNISKTTLFFGEWMRKLYSVWKSGCYFSFFAFQASFPDWTWSFFNELAPSCFAVIINLKNKNSTFTSVFCRLWNKGHTLLSGSWSETFFCVLRKSAGAAVLAYNYLTDLEARGFHTR